MDDVKQLEEDLSTQRKALRKALGAPQKALKALQSLEARGALSEVSPLAAAAAALRDVDLSPLGVDLSSVAEQVCARLDVLRVRARSALLADLTRLARDQDLEATVLTERPLAVLLRPLTAELDLEAGIARLLYAREVVVEAPLVPARILAARTAALDTIRDQALPSPRFFDLAHRAWRTVISARGLEPESRVDLVDLLLPLALLRQDVDEWRALAPEKLAPWPRYLLAYQLRRLRHDGLLQQDGLRLELGVATGGSTRHKRNVIFLPTTPSEGQYHLSIRFVSAR